MTIIKSYAAKEAGGELELYEYDAGELQPEDVEVRVDYCGICHSDLSMIDNEWGFSQYPLVAGHEVIGRVAALGSAAQDKGLKVGQRVGIGWTARSCGHCDACISGNQINCQEGAVPTILNRGGFAEKLRAGWQWVIPLPENIDMASAGPLLCGGITVFTAIDAPYYCYQPRWRHRYWRAGAYRHKAVTRDGLRSHRVQLKSIEGAGSAGDGGQ